jgi:pimeloyl-ACP methyl ester carboxylesterase
MAVDSRALGERRDVLVALPAGYEGSSQRYPVLWLLDAESHFEMATAVTRFMASSGRLPSMIVVGIPNTQRNRDLTPAAMAGFRAPADMREHGGADRFLAFLVEEVAPRLDSTFRTAPFRILSGHSLGGLFALHALVRRPGAFSGFLVMEPAAWWNDRQPMTDARNALAGPTAKRLRVVMVNTAPFAVDTTGWGDVRPMVRFREVSGETHTSMPLPGMILGLRAMFADASPPAWRPGTRPTAVLARYDSLRARLGFVLSPSADTWETVIRMSIHGRFFDDAARDLDRMERELGASASSRELRAMLRDALQAPAPATFVPLLVPLQRPTARQVGAMLGRWIAVSPGDLRSIEIRASGDTIVVHDELQFPDGGRMEGDHPVIQVTPQGVLEWGLPVFRNLPALLVLQGRLEPDGTLRVTRQVRGWAPEGPMPDFTGVLTFRRAIP